RIQRRDPPSKIHHAVIITAGRASASHDTPKCRCSISLVLDSGRTIAEVAKSIGVHEMTLGKWVKKARESGRVPDSDLSEPERAELERLRKENATLRMERDFAKKVATWFAKEQP
ncbi:transposase, partial [Pseudonocardia sp. MH-G8]|uniref:transposase n=1 Tax=Pseudonocardia sp. MH-G8 TaxID=1854588 RepID=UPI001E4D280F